MSIIAVIFCHFQLIEAIRTSASSSDVLLRTTRKPDYSDVYEKIDDNDIFKNIRRIMRIGDPANGIFFTFNSLHMVMYYFLLI